MNENVQGKVVVITGASSGLGEATARLLSAEGAAVVLGARRAERIQALADELTKRGGKALALATDVTDQRWGGPIEEIRPGDVVTIGPNEKHWHGASPTTVMTHLAIQEALDGKAVEWLEKVTDAQYQGGSEEASASSERRSP